MRVRQAVEGVDMATPLRWWRGALLRPWIESSCRSWIVAANSTSHREDHTLLTLSFIKGLGGITLFITELDNQSAKNNYEETEPS